MIDSRCGLHCTNCSWKETHGCMGCIESMGNPFHGECSIAVCCQNKGLMHCGECSNIPCSKLYQYSYLDKEHGDKPQGERVTVCRKWAGESGKMNWSKVLLTSAGFEDMDGNSKENITGCFLELLDKPAAHTKVLFVPTAAINKEAKKMAEYCYLELVHTGISAENIRLYNIGDELGEEELLDYDVVYFTGGDTGYLLNRLRETGFDSTVKKMVHHNKVYVGVSAGSLIAAPNIGDPFTEATRGLCLLNAYLSVHCTEETVERELPLPHIRLRDNQALLVTYNGYILIED
ncbi:Type 1 glutamine amidotransferase-like domain-containing protein [Anaerocolumna xylanovorans]|uniref:Peptidase E n=1 Tax=Anaerocolumna xylanovorans DSM 12503 TaxID=1121345 RepID=A0A1M7Y178_9FIRM|nr:Type 1 glutamine amidotransferase-like domain-containing protein [Anaerocolumna xylanovorans]SHO45524.1 Protein of unknown function [Anaerocolumna xylanovorans DSM 12503]